MTEEEFKEQYAIARKLTEDWPAWKLNILKNSNKPTVDTPRKPVDNSQPYQGDVY